MQVNQEIADRVEASLSALNARIARLAIALNVPIDNAAAMHEVMHQSGSVIDFPDRRKASVGERHAPNADRRQAHKRDELRGLLVLRYDLETRSLSQQGLERTQEMMRAIEVDLLHQGFKPGADGMEHDGLLNR